MNTRWIVAAAAVLAVGAGVWAVVDRLAAPEHELSTTSDEAYALYEEGRDHIERYALEEALEAFQAAAEADTNFAMAYLRSSQALYALGQSLRGRLELGKAYDKRQLASEVERLWIELHEARYSAQEAAADSLVDELVARHGDHPWVLRLQGEEARVQARHAEALEFYQRALELDPEAVDIHNMMGYVYLAMGDYDEAVRSLQRYAFYAPD